MSCAARSTIRCAGAWSVSPARNAGRVDVDHRCAHRRGALGGFGRHGVPDEGQSSVAVAQVIRHLPRLQQRVHRHHDPARPQHAEVDGGELGDVGQHDAHPVAGADRAGLQQGRDACAGLVELVIGERGLTQTQGDAVGHSSGGFGQDGGQIHRRVPKRWRFGCAPTLHRPAGAAHRPRAPNLGPCDCAHAQAGGLTSACGRFPGRPRGAAARAGHCYPGQKRSRWVWPTGSAPRSRSTPRVSSCPGRS